MYITTRFPVQSPRYVNLHAFGLFDNHDGKLWHKKWSKNIKVPIYRNGLRQCTGDSKAFYYYFCWFFVCFCFVMFFVFFFCVYFTMKLTHRGVQKKYNNNKIQKQVADKLPRDSLLRQIYFGFLICTVTRSLSNS